MSFYWLYNLSSLALCLIVVVSFVTICLSGLFVSRGWVKRLHKTDHSHNDIVGFYSPKTNRFTIYDQQAGSPKGRD